MSGHYVDWRTGKGLLSRRSFTHSAKFLSCPWGLNHGWPGVLGTGIVFLSCTWRPHAHPSHGQCGKFKKKRIRCQHVTWRYHCMRLKLLQTYIAWLYEHKLPPGVVSPVFWDMLSLLEKQNGNNERIRQYTSVYVRIRQHNWVWSVCTITNILHFNIQISKINSSI